MARQLINEIEDDRKRMLAHFRICDGGYASRAQLDAFAAIRGTDKDAIRRTARVCNVSFTDAELDAIVASQD